MLDGIIYPIAAVILIAIACFALAAGVVFAADYVHREAKAEKEEKRKTK